ncbi:M14 family metallopeptidase [Winogradskyella aurantia]|uniref:Peptidase n=1 Tax=Winogradskyella aurantia TaxID=1915063 RepID=A0A265UZ54_9FLAO|nr:M14 family metallocarboxypeptidase [Winogradskyella aurantia]OZV70576.1 peptidase [Winogradskyella aurantia]
MKNVIILICTVLSITAYAQFSPQSKKITEKFFPDSEAILNTTPALQKKRGFTNYKELMAFLNTVKSSHSDKVEISFIGKSQKGKDIPIIKINVPNSKDKIKVWMQGGVHGNEPASTETMLYLIDRLLNDNSHENLMEHLDLAIVPMANIDGYLKNDRYAANGLDLNRDQTKLMAPESIAIKQAYSDFNPDVSVDFHEYRPYRRDFARMGDFGITNMYDVMFLRSSNLNIPENLRVLTERLFIENARKPLDVFGYTHHPYISTTKVDGEIHINQGSISSRSFATNTALTNTISALIEIRGVGLGKTSFKRRIHSGFSIALSFLRTATENIALVKDEIEQAKRQQNDVVVEYKRGIYQDNVSFIDVNSNEYIDINLTIRDAEKATSTLTRKRPKAYIVEANQTDIINKLTILGVDIEYLENEKTYDVETYVIDNYSAKPIRYEKMKLQTVSVDLKKQQLSFPKGTALVYMNQRRANIVPEILEPEAPNSLVSFGVIKTKKGDTLPIYRLLN